MRAQVLSTPRSIDARPLELRELPNSPPGAGEVVLDVACCGVCHTDLHVVEGELPRGRLPVVPGHQVVGRVAAVGSAVSSVAVGDRVGVPWLGWTCGACAACLAGRENLCPNARFTGWQVDGGYADRMVADAAFVHRVPDGFSDEAAAPLMCAGAIGWRALRLAEAEPGGKLGLFGFGASAHLVLQIARHRGSEVFVYSRNPAHREQALKLGAAWAGPAGERAPSPLDSAILFAPAGWLVPLALEALAPGGTLAIASIHMSEIPAMDYGRTLFRERTLRSVAHGTREDVRTLLALAAEIPLRPEVEVVPLAGANEALGRLKRSEVKGALVLACR